MGEVAATRVGSGKIPEKSNGYFFVPKDFLYISLGQSFSRNSQITFLHVYHHVTMFFIWWIAAKWFPGGSSFFSPMLNTFVHTIMYTYYMLSAFGDRFRKYLWWKKYLTMLQLIQFIVVISQNTYALVTDCDFDKRVEFSCVIYLCSLFLLFSNFFIKSYLKPKRSRGQMSHDPKMTAGGELLSDKGVTVHTNGPRQRSIHKDA